MSVTPIWLDSSASLGIAESADYTIKTGGEVIYSGHAVRLPGGVIPLVRVNDICADHLKNVLPSINLDLNDDESVKTFQVCDSMDNVIKTYTFSNDWSYKTSRLPVMSDPINGKIQANQRVFFSRYGDGDIVATIHYTDGTSSTYTIDASDQQSLAATGVFDLTNMNNIKSIDVSSVHYEVADTCARYALLYANAFGGWDTLIQGGNVSETDKYTRHNVKVNGSTADDNGDNRRDVVNYANQVEKTYTFVTGWLTDDQASRMHHLMGSTSVHLYDLVSQTFIPVTITDTECAYKTYKTNGNALVNYTINLSVAETRTRR